MRRTTSLAAAAATKLLAEFSISTPDRIDVDTIAYSRGAYIEYAPLLGAAGRLVRDERLGVIRVDSGIREEGQRRFAGAHELGHFVLHEKDRNASCTPEDMLAWYKTSRKEQEANEFAAEFLMPYEPFLGSCDRSDLSLASLERLAGRFRTTLTATAIRYADIGPHVCAVVQSQRGVIRWFHKAPDFAYRLFERGAQVQPDSGAHEFFAGRMDGPESEMVLADRWLVDKRIEADWKLLEVTIPMPSYESALSILWIVPKSPLDYCAAEDD